MSSMGKVVDEKPKTPKGRLSPALLQSIRAKVGLGFATDTDISGTTTAPQERELKPWVNDDLPKSGSGPRQSNGAGVKDKETFGGEANIPWDQFETNSRLFGTKTSYQEEIYTTKLNKTGPDFEKRKKEADRLASEIMNVSLFASLATYADEGS
jgi:PAB1-binding protein PBP1